MATFAPFREYILSELDDLAGRCGLAGPFLEVGCGQGFNAAHLARRGWTGVAVDASSEACRAARANLEGFPRVAVECGTLESYEGGPFATVLLLDVLEHIEDDAAALDAVARLQRPGGALVLLVPTHMDEWRWDDEVYGHVRRYDPAGLTVLLGHAGYDVVEMRDVTFPVLWALRRGYTMLKRRPMVAGTTAERTRESSRSRAWEMGIVSEALDRLAPWRLIFAAQRRFRHRLDLGHEAIVLARRRAG